LPTSPGTCTGPAETKAHPAGHAACSARGMAGARHFTQLICWQLADVLRQKPHAEFARYLEVARRSRNALMDCLDSARLKGFLSIKEFNHIERTTRRLYPALNKLIAYLRRRDTD